MNKFLKVLDKILSVILIALVAFIAIGVSGTVVARYFFGYSSTAFEEFLTVAFVLIVFFGAALSIREKQHISITYLIDKSKKHRAVFDIIDYVIIALINVALCYYSIVWISKIGHTISPASGLKMGYYYIAVPITSAIAVFYCIIEILQHFIKIDDADKGYLTDDVLPGDEEAK